MELHHCLVVFVVSILDGVSDGREVVDVATHIFMTQLDVETLSGSDRDDIAGEHLCIIETFDDGLIESVSNFLINWVAHGFSL